MLHRNGSPAAPPLGVALEQTTQGESSRNTAPFNKTMKNENEEVTPFKRFLNLCAEGKETEAYELAHLIANSSYPNTLRRICAKYIQDNNHVKSPEPPSVYTTNLHDTISSVNENINENIRWLPSRLIQSQQAQEPKENNKLIDDKSLALKISCRGLDFMEILNTNLTSEVVKAIDSFFDHFHYTRVHADMRGKSRIEALEHYAIHGGKEETREPNLLFLNSEFFELYPWVRRVKINPLYLFSHWPHEFSHYANIVARRYNILKSIGVSSGLAFSSQSTTSRFKLSQAEDARIIAITHEQSKKPKLVTPQKEGSLIIHVVIPDFTAGGGGHMTIFRMVKHLELAGHTCTIWIKGYNHNNHPLGASRSATTYYQPIKSKVLPLNAHYAFASGDALIATSWDTVETVLANKNFKDHFYLVQDYEPYFYARGSQSLKAERTYHQNLKTICASTWLHDIMKTKFGRQSVSFDLAFNPDIYYPPKNRYPINGLSSTTSDGQNLRADGTKATNRPVVRIAFYARTRTERRAVELAIEGLSLVEQKEYDLCVELFGEDRGRIKLTDNVVAIDHGILSPNELANLYRGCDIGLTFSATNYALVPQEMMACGLPVIEIDNDSTRAIYPPEALWLAEPSASSIALAIETLAKNKEIRERIAKNGMDWVSKHSWEQSFKTVEQFIKAEVNKKQSLPVHTSSSGYYQTFPYQPIRMSTVKDPLASIVIPTLNGGDMLLESVDKILAQVLDHNYELLIIDSMSNDGSIKRLPLDQRISLYEVSQSDFQHGRTRNMAVSLAKGQYIAFLTQDAIPLNDHWLSNIIRPLIESDDVVAVFGRHMAHVSHSPIAGNMLDSHFESFVDLGIHNISSSLKDYWAENPGFRQIMHYYSDNNSCLRKNFWESFPYPDVDYGEDQLFADWVAQNEFTKAYAHNAVVMHSHQYTFEEEFKRSKTEAYFFAKYFGYDLSQTRIDIELSIKNEAARLVASYGDSLEKTDIENLLANIRAKHEGYSSGVKQFWEWLDQSKRIH